jgi:hypothetical protein
MGLAVFFNCRETKIMNSFSFLRRPQKPDLSPLKSLIRDRLQLCEDTALTINEIICADPDCPGLETIILIMEPGQKTRALKLPKPILEIDEGDLEILLKPSLPLTGQGHEPNP